VKSWGQQRPVQAAVTGSIPAALLGRNIRPGASIGRWMVSLAAPHHRTLYRLVVVLAVMLALGVTACDTDGGGGPSSSATATTDTAKVREQILADYDAWMAVNVATAAKADFRSPDLAKHLVDPELTERVNALKTLQRSGLVVTGRPTWVAHVSSLRLEAVPPTAALRVCLDTTRWTLVFKATGKVAEAKGQAERYYVAVTAQQRKGRWYIARSTEQRDQPC
jgi:hypothetical protein